MSNQPTHKVFFVQDVGKDKPLWRQIGAAWSHKSGNGFSVDLDLIPADFSAGDLVVLEDGGQTENSSDDTQADLERAAT